MERDVIITFMKINEEFKVARRKSLIYCPTPDCNQILYKPENPK
jgi:hypothetical protein